jgi:hypothetical protein
MAIRLGFIGTGGIAQGHMQRLSGIDGVEAVAHYDVIAERAQNSAEKWGGKPYGSVEALVGEGNLDGVVICTPPFAHGESVEKPVCEAGLPFLIEKPVAVDIATARQVETWVKEKGIATVVAYKYRWDDHVNKAREMLTDRIIGLVHGDFWGGLPGVPWWRVVAQSGGQFVEQTTVLRGRREERSGLLLPAGAPRRRESGRARRRNGQPGLRVGCRRQHLQHLHAEGLGDERHTAHGQGLHAGGPRGPTELDRCRRQ